MEIIVALYQKMPDENQKILMNALSNKTPKKVPTKNVELINDINVFYQRYW